AEDFPMSFGTNEDVLTDNEIGIVVEDAGGDDVHGLARIGVWSMGAAYAAESMLGPVDDEVLPTAPQEAVIFDHHLRGRGGARSLAATRAVADHNFRMLVGDLKADTAAQATAPKHCDKPSAFSQCRSAPDETCLSDQLWRA